MPYYQRSWNVSMGCPPSRQASTKKIRTAPIGEAATGPQLLQKSASMVSVDNSQIDAIQQQMKAQLEELKATKCATPIKGDDNFLNYVLQKDSVVFDGKYSTIYACFNHQSEENFMICRIYQPNSLIVPENDMFLKVIKYIGKKNPDIISTMDVYADEGRHIYVFQEYANRGNAYDFVKNPKNPPLTEAQVSKWGKSIVNAMDFLGNAGISHRSIQPKHMLLKTADNGEIIAKLSSFRDAVIYWDPATRDIIDQPCKPVAKRPYYGFQAPEVFGEEGEFYNPSEADVWSLGATLFFLAGRALPYNLHEPEPNLDEAIFKNVSGARLSDEAKKCFIGLMRANTDPRTDFNSIASDPWFKLA